MAKNKTAFVCENCGYDSVKWYGKCPACGTWDSLKEFKINSSTAAGAPGSVKSVPESLDEIKTDGEARFKTGFGELDRVLGGGAVKGSLVLIGGEPGIGKSTLMLQICASLSKKCRILYASGEESKRQLKLRADRLGIRGEGILIVSETNLEEIISHTEAEKPDILIVDSIQTVYKSGGTSPSAAPGNTAQIKECAMTLLRLAKTSGIIVFVVGHVNKEGDIAGPKILEHIVDCVLYFEGEKQSAYRILRAAKNRFGSTNEIGVFEMGAKGLAEVPNPSEAMLAGRPADVPGTCITATMEGTRPILAEIQALVSRSVFGNPRRMSSGIDYNRTVLLLAVLEKRAGLFVGNCDAYINVIGGLKIEEPAADLATIIALVSSYKEIPVARDTLVIGEVGLTGELRRVSSLEQRLHEAERMNIRRCICPWYGQPRETPGKIEIIKVKNICEAIEAALTG